MEPKEFSKYHSWCNARRIRVYPVPTSSIGEFNLAVERSGNVAVGRQIFYNKPSTADKICVWKQIGVLLKAICYKELNLMEIKSTFNQLEGICAATFKNDIPSIISWLSAGVPFREAVLYLEGFYPDKKESATLIYKTAHCLCGQPATKWTIEPPLGICGNCNLRKGLSQIEYRDTL